MASDTDIRATGPDWSRSAVIGAASVLACACLAASIGEPGPVAGSASVLYLVLTQGALAALYLLGAFGLGLGLVRLLAPGVPAPNLASLGVGLGAMLTLSHLLGVTGLLDNRVAAIVPVAIGVGILARSTPVLLAAARSAPRPGLLWLAGVPAAGVLIAAACSPPGWLWSSEFGGYDTLVYHLQLPREWHAMGRVWPVEHNVYSFLPSYVETAFVHLASLAGVPREGFVSADGSLLIACKLLHAGMALGAAGAAAGAARALLGDGPSTRAASASAGVLVIATPWSVVTGSMAYNELAVLLLLFSAVHMAAGGGLSPLRRGALAGAMVGAACGCKPTALLLGAPVLGLVMLVSIPRRGWLAAFGAGAVAGAAMLSPWLVRNGIAAGNPVFPALTSVFGSAHWSAEQVARYTSAHRFDGSLLRALTLLVASDPNDPAAGPGSPVHRGLLHPQWAFAGPLFVVTALTAVLAGGRRRLGLALAGGVIVQVLVWATTTHVQSRFLMPTLVPIALLLAVSVAVGLDWVRSRAGPMRGALLTVAAALLATSATTVGLFAGESRRRGGPNALIARGSAHFTEPVFWGDDPAGWPPDVFLMTALPPDAELLIVGDAAALYKPLGSDYATTYDDSPLARALREHPDDPRAAIGSIDATHLYVDWLELGRLSRTGWADPALDPDTLQSVLFSHAILAHVFELSTPQGEQLAARELYLLPETTE